MQLPADSVCNTHYYEYQKGQCCPDTNDNQICDTDEQEKQVEIPQPILILNQTSEPRVENKPLVLEVTTEPLKNKTLMQELLGKVNTSYFFWNELDDAGALVIGTKRSSGYVEYEFAQFFYNYNWNTKDNVVYIMAGQIAERWFNRKNASPQSQVGNVNYIQSYFKVELTGNPDEDVKRIPIEFQKYYFGNNMDKKFGSDKYKGDRKKLIIFDSFYTKSPVDYMEEYAEEIPIKVDNISQQVGASGRKKTSKLGLHFKKKEDPSKMLVFRFDPTDNVPLTIDELSSDGKLVRRIDFYFSTTVTYQGKAGTPILDKFVDLPKNYAIIMPKEYDEYLEASEGGGWTEYEKRT